MTHDNLYILYHFFSEVYFNGEWMDEEDFVEKELNLSDEPREYIDEDRVVGIYSSEEKAQAALERYKNKPGFIDKPNAFLIEKITLGKITGWTSGFGIE